MAVFKNVRIGGRTYTVYTGKNISKQKVSEVKTKRPKCLASSENVSWSCVSQSRDKRVTGHTGRLGEPTFVVLRDNQSGKQRVMHYSCYDLQVKDNRPKGRGGYARRKYKSDKKRYM